VGGMTYGEDGYGGEVGSYCVQGTSFVFTRALGVPMGGRPCCNKGARVVSGGQRGGDGRDREGPHGGRRADFSLYSELKLSIMLLNPSLTTLT
jgi:hypothetical protein